MIKIPKIPPLITLWRWLLNHKRDLEIIALFAAISSPFAVLILGNQLSKSTVAAQRDIASTQVLDSFFNGVEGLLLAHDPSKDSFIIARAQRVIRGINIPKYSAAVLQFISDTGRSDLFIYTDRSESEPAGYMSQFIDLSFLNLTDQKLVAINLRKSSLVHANLRGAMLPFANLAGALLWDTNLNNAYMYRANLDKAFLKDAILRGAVLNEASLKEADLSGADLSGAVFDNADLTGVKLTSARHIAIDQLAKAKTLYGAELPADISAIMRTRYGRLFRNNNCLTCHST